MNNHFSRRRHLSSWQLLLPVIEHLCHLRCVARFESPSGVDSMLGYFIHMAEIRNIWHPISSWHSSSRTSSIISLMHAGSFALSFWTPPVPYFMNWQETRFLAALWLRACSTSPYLIWLLLLDATWSMKQNLSGTLPKANALSATPAVQYFCFFENLCKSLDFLFFFICHFVISKNGRKQNFPFFPPWRITFACSVFSCTVF